MSTYNDIKERFNSENKSLIFEQGIKDACNKVMNQTDYDYETAFIKLKEHNLDILAIVREWMGTDTSIKILSVYASIFV